VSNDIRNEPGEPLTNEAADCALRDAIRRGRWPDAPTRLPARATKIVSALLIHIGAERDPAIGGIVRQLAAEIEPATLERVIAEGPWLTECERWSELSPDVRTKWLLDWLEELRVKTRRARHGEQT
jgi:hypothetical protein